MYQQSLNPTTGAVDPNSVLYTDPNGLVWWVPVGHRLWAAYQQWVAAGNTPLPAA